jgi:hypothetical protein
LLSQKDSSLVSMQNSQPLLTSVKHPSFFLQSVKFASKVFIALAPVRSNP